MLNELKEYALENGLAVLPGYKEKLVKAYIRLTGAGEFVGIDDGGGDVVPCPDLSSAKNSTTKCSFLVEKADIILLLDPKRRQKFDFFMGLLERGAEAEPRFAVCRAALSDEAVLDRIRQEFQDRKFKAGDTVGFKVAGERLERTEGYRVWWDGVRKEFETKPKKKTSMVQCFITGELTEPVLVVPKVDGLLKVGGHTSGDALICFQENSYRSYGFKKSANAAVSREGIETVNAALTSLLAGAPTLGGGKFLHWYKDHVPKERDPALLLNFDFDGVYDEDAPEDEAPQVNHRVEAEKATRLIESLRAGSFPEELDNLYYILTLSGANGRIMVRDWQQGSYDELRQDIVAWFDDLRIIRPNGNALSPPPKLFALQIRLLHREKASKSLSRRIADELSGLTAQLMFSIIHNKPLPDAVAVRALAHIRSGMMASGDDQTQSPDGLSCQLLKAFLIRRQRERNEEVTVSEKLNPLSGSIPYQIGRMMAVYAAIQRDALGDVNAGVVERYYGAAITAPALVLGQLSKLCNHHLSKMDNQRYAMGFKRRLQAIAVNIPVSPPTTLTLEEQGQFALGYYQENADIYARKESKAAAEAPNANEEETL